MCACVYVCVRYLLEGGRTASLSCVPACMDACVTSLRERELPACHVCACVYVCVHVCMDACLTSLREGELPACHVCMHVWMHALPT